MNLQFSASVSGAPVECGKIYSGLGTGASSMRIQDLRWYVHNLQYRLSNGQTLPAQMPVRAPWQNASVGLISLVQNCDAATPVVNNSLETSVRKRATDTITGVCFDLGVPAALNHQDNAIAEAPLNSSGMFWVWQSGYKFFRLDAAVNPEATPVGFNVHLGSTGCTSPSATQAPTEACLFGNRPRICIEGFDPTKNKIHLAVEQLVQGLDVSKNTPKTAPGCMSGNNDPECISILPALGVDFTFNDGVTAPVVYPSKAVNSVFYKQ